jgi:hydroxymethylbilane synthase
MKTQGDKILDVALAKIGGKGLFTKELENSMLANESHIAVHSLKDVPTKFEDGLILGAVTKREEVFDAFVSVKYKSLDDLPKGAIVGTTSLRRKMQLLIYRPDLKIESLRGNVGTRIKKLQDGNFDAIILAKAGINRLGILNYVEHINSIPIDIMIPAMGQAALGIETTNNSEIIDIISPLNDTNSYIETKIERDFIDSLDGGCQVPIGVNAKISGQSIRIRVILGLPDGSRAMKQDITVSIDSFANIGREIANEMIANGAKELLLEAERMVL